MISKLYDESKEAFLNQLRENSSLSQGDKGRGSIISLEEVYFTEEDASEFTKYINNFLDNHKVEEVVPEKRTYQCFLSIIRKS